MDGAPDNNFTANYLYGPVQANDMEKTLCPYIGYSSVPSMAVGPPAPVELCPSGRMDGTKNDRRADGNPNFSYSFNAYLCYPSTYVNRGSKITNVKKTSRRVLCADSTAHGGSLWTNTSFPSRHNGGTDNL